MISPVNIELCCIGWQPYWIILWLCIGWHKNVRCACAVRNICSDRVSKKKFFVHTLEANVRSQVGLKFTFEQTMSSLAVIGRALYGIVINFCSSFEESQFTIGSAFYM